MADDALQLIIDNLHENLEIEIKNWLDGLDNDNAKAKLAKEIIALANHGGGNIFIGFGEDGNDFEDLSARPGELEAFTQDKTTAIVDRYIEPPIQCRVHTRSRDGATQQHPIIEVPGGRRAPVWAKRDSPDQRTLKQATVYVRRPGAKSERIRTRDDWEKLIDRYVGARQSEILHAIRNVINPPKPELSNVQTLHAWEKESRAEWQGIVDRFDLKDPRRFQKGFWTFSFRIYPFPNPSLAELSDALDRQMPKHSGWPPFTYLHREGVRPYPKGDVIQAYIGTAAPVQMPADRAEHADFWRVREDGYGFLLRPFQEDQTYYLENRNPMPIGPFFDCEVPAYRVTELIKFIDSLARAFYSIDSEADILLNYFHMNARHLESNNFGLIVHTGAICKSETISSPATIPINEIALQTPEIVYNLLKPVYEQFEFSELPKRLVDKISSEVVARRY